MANLSVNAKKQFNLLSPVSTHHYLLTVSHPAISDLHFVVGTCNITSRGVEYAPIGASLTLPMDKNESPLASLVLDGVSHGLADIVERTLGLRNATVLIEMVLSNEPDDVELSLDMDVREVTLSSSRVSLGLGYENTIGQIAINAQYRQAPNPQLF